MTVDISGAASFLREHDDYMILTHSHPDGDTLGSAFGLCRVLRALGKRANVTCNDVIHHKYDYLLVDEQQFTPETVVSVDVADPVLLGSNVMREYGEKIQLCIDHHGTNKLSADFSLIDGSAAACAEIIAKTAIELSVEITADIADCLFTGITTDTGCFRYSNVTPQTHMIAAMLIEKGARASEINEIMFETKTVTYAALEKLALETMRFYYGGRCAFITITQKMFEISGSDESECEGIAALPRQVEGVLVGVTLRERKDGTFKASIRTRNGIDASEICTRLGGGGHKNASGCQLEGDFDSATQAILKAVGESL